MENWNIKPNLGLGSMLLGMSPRQTNEFDQAFGPVESKFRYQGLGSEFFENLGPFADLFSDEILEGAQNDLDEFEQDNRFRYEQVRNQFGYLRNDYHQEALIAITARHDCQNINLDGNFLFSLTSREVLQLMGQRFGIGLCHDDTVIFSPAGIILKGFHFQREGRVWRYYQDSMDHDVERFVIICTDAELQKSITPDFLEVDFSTR